VVRLFLAAQFAAKKPLARLWCCWCQNIFFSFVLISITLSSSPATLLRHTKARRAPFERSKAGAVARWGGAFLIGAAAATAVSLQV
jgi:hypothetical protein